MCKVVLMGLVAILGCFTFPNVVIAHKASILSWVQGDILYTESRFDSGRKIKNGIVEIIDSNGNTIITGRTDEKGSFSAKITKIDDLKIILVTSCGHKSLSTILKYEFQYVGIKEDMCSNADLRTTIKYPTLEEIELIVSQQLNSKLTPIKKTMAFWQQKRVGFHDVLGGVGYIIGLVGVGAYIKYRQT